MAPRNGLRLNPFQPDQPVRPSIFTGRSAELASVRSTLIDTLRGQASHVLILGDRGMGKTSLAHYLLDLAVSPEVTEAAGGVKPPASVFVSLGFAGGVAGVCASILSETYRWARERNPSVIEWFRSELGRIEGLKIDFYGISLEARTVGSQALPRAFPDAIEGFVKRNADAAGGLVAILDETEAVSGDPTFPGFFKSLAEVLTARRLGNVQFIMTATPEGRDRMSDAHASFPRLFRPVSIGALSDPEVIQLVHRALAEGLPRKTADGEFLEKMTYFASGIPSFVHEIGRAAFEVDDDDLLGLRDFLAGVEGTDRVVGAIAVLEQRLFRERYSRKVLSNTYRTILHAMARIARHSDRDEVTVDQVRRECPDVDQVAPYLANMAKRGVVVRVEGQKGLYRLPDRMFRVFLLMADKSFRPLRRSEKS